jgi:hypothetical protein
VAFKIVSGSRARAPEEGLSIRRLPFQDDATTRQLTISPTLPERRPPPPPAPFSVSLTVLTPSPTSLDPQGLWALAGKPQPLLNLHRSAERAHCSPGLLGISKRASSLIPTPGLGDVHKSSGQLTHRDFPALRRWVW